MPSKVKIDLADFSASPAVDSRGANSANQAQFAAVYNDELKALTNI